MCLCSRSVKVRAIGIICIVLTALSALNLVRIAATGDVGYDILSLYNGNYILALYIQSMIFVVHLIIYIILIFGSIYNNKCLIVPFIVVTTLQILLLIVLAVYFVYLGISMYLILLAPLFAVIGCAMYFLVIAVQCYREIDNISFQRTSIQKGHRRGNMYNINSNRCQTCTEVGATPNFHNLLQQPLGLYPKHIHRCSEPLQQYVNLNNAFWNWKRNQRKF